MIYNFIIYLLLRHSMAVTQYGHASTTDGWGVLHSLFFLIRVLKVY